MSATMSETYTEALGIRPGDLMCHIAWDIVDGLCQSRPVWREIERVKPEPCTAHLWDYRAGYSDVLLIRDYPTVSLHGTDGRREWGVGGVFRVGDRWYEEGRNGHADDEVLIQRGQRELVGQLPMMLDTPAVWEPYPFQADVDYDAGDAYHCHHCGQDANLPRRTRHGGLPGTHPPACPACLWPMLRIIMRRFNELPVS